MVEVVRGIRYRNPGDKIFGRPIRPVPERIGPAVARNGARRETSPGSSRREVLTLRGLAQVPHASAMPPMRAEKPTPLRCGQGPEHHVSKKLSWQPQVYARRVQHALIIHLEEKFKQLQEAAEYLARIGVPREKLRVTGIPIDPLFAAPLNRFEARKRLGLDADAAVILISAGGYGVGPVEQLVRDLLTLQRPWQIVAIAGKSEKTRKRLEELAKEAGKLPEGSPKLCPVGFTSEMDKYMAAADLMVGKAGGLTTSEALSRSLPMALIEPIPGQVERNADHLMEAGAAIRCNNLPAAAWKIAALMDDSARLVRMRDAAKSLGRPGAAAAIAEDALRLVD